nr:ATP-binding cassette domain-containing protein [Anaerofilum hominis]
MTVGGVQKLDSIDLEVHPGEILGVIGIDGNGQEELVDAICGKAKIDGGEILLEGQNIVGKSIKQIKDMGLSTVYEDRHKDGLVLKYSVRDNLILGYQDRPQYLAKWKAFLNQKAIQKNAEDLQKAFDIRCGSLEVFAGTLSGGNQQKIILAREVSARPKLLMVVQPTRGLDMGAIEFVQDKVVEQRNAGCGVLLFTLELDEVLQLSDRIAVIHNGRIIKTVVNKNVTKQQIGRYMLGVLDDGTEEAAE